MADLSPYFLRPSESREEQEERLLELLRGQVGMDPSITPHGALPRGYAPPPGATSPTPITDRRYSAPPEPTRENAGITDIDEIEPPGSAPPPSPRPAGDELIAQAQGERLPVVPVTDRGIPLTPTAPAAAPTDPRAAALSVNPMDELIRARETPPEDHTQESKRYFTEGGQRPNFMGLEDEFGFDPFKQQQRARELYAQASVPESRRWEDEYLKGRKYYTDDDILRGQLIYSFIGGPQAGLDFRKMATGERAAYDKGLYEARDRDLAGQRVSPGLAEAIAASGMATPEAAIQLRMNDPLVKAFTSGGYSQGLRARGQEYGMAKTYVGELGRNDRADHQRKAQLENTALRGVLGIQAALANKGIQADPQKIHNMLGSMFASSLGLENAAAGQRVADGDLSGLTPEQARKAEILRPQFEHAITNEKTLNQVVANVVKEETGREAKRESAVATYVEKARSDPKYRLKFKNDWESAATPLREAIAAWHQMSDDGKKAFVQWAPTGIPGTISKFITSPQDQQLAGSVRGLLNAYVKANAGSAVTGSEWDRVAAEIGISTGSWSPFQGTGQIEDFFRRSGKLLGMHRKNFEREIGPWDAIAEE